VLTDHIFETNDVILYIHSVHKHRGNTFQRQNYKMRLKQMRLNWINSMQVKKILFRADVTVGYMNRNCLDVSVLRSYWTFSKRISDNLWGEIGGNFCSYILQWHLLGHAKMSVICFDLQFSRSTRPMTSFCIFIAYINTEGIHFIFSVNFISLPQEVRGIFVIKAAVEMQNNLPFCD
jgi:hypothetical protein